MFSKKIQLNLDGQRISVATALVLIAIEELMAKESTVYGYRIMSHLKENFQWKNVKSGTVYPILKKLKRDGLIKSDKDAPKEGGRQQIFYHLTDKGHALVTHINNLQDQALDAALDRKSESKKQSNQIIAEDFTGDHFVDNILAPFLQNFKENISRLISPKSTLEELKNIEEQLKKSEKVLELYKNIMQNLASQTEGFKQLKET